MRDGLAEERFRVWLRGLSGERLGDLGMDYQRLAFEGGLALVRPDGAATPIPPALTPAIERPDGLLARAALAQRLLSGLVRANRFFLGGAGRGEADAVLQGLSTWERELCDRTWTQAEGVAIARVDLFTDSDGVDRPLEMNATIPAMQGYADIAAQALLRAVGQAAGLDRAFTDDLTRENGSNADDLCRSLVAHHRRLGGRERRPRVAMVARAGDPQSTELAALCARWNLSGEVEAQRCTPEQLQLDGAGRAFLLGDAHPIDLIYRHLFARRIDPKSDLGRIALEPARHQLLNPPNSQLEMKSLFAELSAAAADPARAAAMGLSPDELQAAGTAPWSRRLAKMATLGPSGERIDDLLAFAAENPRALVLKRSWGYGGTSVLLGDELDEAQGQARGRELLQRTDERPVSWPELVRGCAERGGFIVQARIELAPERHLVAVPEGPRWEDWYVDVSAYTNLGVDRAPTGGVRRGSRSRIVNIVGGGGLVPMLSAPVAERLLAALRG